MIIFVLCKANITDEKIFNSHNICSRDGFLMRHKPRRESP